MAPPIEQGRSLSDLLDGQTKLRPFPAVASQILSICENPNVRPRDLSQVIQCDPAVALRLLRVANSSMYGFAGDILSIDHAIVVLGFRNVRDLAVSAAAADMFASGDGAAAARETLWLHSLACASIARTLAAHVEVAPEEAFLAGIVHDVGKLVFFDAVPEEYIQVNQQADSITIIDMEKSEFGVSHQVLGQRCAEDWGLPAEIDSAIGYHHEPEAAASAEQLVSVICVANALAHAWHLGCSNGTEEEATVALQRTELPLSTEQVEELRAQAVSDYEVLRETCGS